MSERVDPISAKPFGSWGLGFDRPLLIAGPCSAEAAHRC
jgi:hypothetical protein